MDPKSTNPTSDDPKQPSPEALVEELAELDLGRHVSKKTINQIMIPAHHHDERKLFVGGLLASGTSYPKLVFHGMSQILHS